MAYNTDCGLARSGGVLKEGILCDTVPYCALLGDSSEVEFAMSKENAQSGDANDERTELSEVDERLVSLVAVGLTDEEIATQLQIPRHNVLDQIARLLAKLGVRDRLEIVLYAFSDPAMASRISTEFPDRTAKKPQAQLPGVNLSANQRRQR